MPRPEIEEFAKSLVRCVRDAAIRNCDNLLTPHASSPAARRWKKSSVHGCAEVVIPDVVDEALFCLLMAIDEGAMHIKFVSSTGQEIDLTADGMAELAGWYSGSGGWRAMFSEQRFVDDCADLGA